jgi:hypothetical protein
MPPSARVFYTLEISQSSFAQPARVVANVGDDIVLGIEASAPRDSGAMVTGAAARSNGNGNATASTKKKLSARATARAARPPQLVGDARSCALR